VNYYNRLTSGGITVINGGQPVILQTVHLLSSAENGANSVLQGYIVLEDMSAGNKLLWKWLAGYKTVGRNCLISFDPGLYVPSLRVVKEQNDQMVITWGLPT
jgi:hypothetical protein